MRRLVATVVGVISLCGCAGDLQFERDDRLRFVSPADRSTVVGSVTIRWRFDEDGRRTGASTTQSSPRFAVFVDRSPMRPGQTLLAIPEVDRICGRRAACEDPFGLAAAGIHVVDAPQLALPALPPGRGVRLGELRKHEVTVVPIDRDERRAGESAWTLTLYTREEDT